MPTEFVIPPPIDVYPDDQPTAPLAYAPTGTIGNYLTSFEWEEVPGATWYYLWVSGPEGHLLDRWYDRYNAEHGLTCTAGRCTTPVLEVYSGQFTWWVQYFMPPTDYSAWSAPTVFNVTTKAPDTFTVIGTTSSTPTYQWGRVKGAEWYYMWITHETQGHILDQWFSRTEICIDMTCSLTPEDLNYPNGNIYWWVQAWSTGGGYSVWGSQQQFTFQSPPATQTPTFTPSSTPQPNYVELLLPFTQTDIPRGGYPHSSGYVYSTGLTSALFEASLILTLDPNRLVQRIEASGEVWGGNTGRAAGFYGNWGTNATELHWEDAATGFANNRAFSISADFGSQPILLSNVVFLVHSLHNSGNPYTIAKSLRVYYAVLTPTPTPTSIPCSVFGCTANSFPVDYGSNHIGQANAVDVVPVGVTTGAPAYFLLDDEWPINSAYSNLATVHSVVVEIVQVLSPPPGRTCTGCGDIRVRTDNGICYQFKHLVPLVSTNTVVTLNQVIGTVIRASLDSTPIIGAGDQSHLHIDRYTCDENFIQTGNGYVPGDIRDVISHLVNP